MFWPLILINSIFKQDASYYSQLFQKHIEKSKKVIRYITDDLKFYCDDWDRFVEE